LQAKTCQSPASGARYAFDLLLDEKRRKENAAKIAREKAETKRRLEEEKARITKEKAHMAEVFLKENDMEKTLREIKSSVGQLTLRMGDIDAVLESLKQQQAKKGGGDGRKKARL
jgi:Na+-translocating ferredoxin:NAD+ oxidoreductase RnfC subunit